MMNFYLTIIISFNFFHGFGYGISTQLFNQSSANTYCADYGGLLHYMNATNDGFLKLDFINSDAVALSEGESAWISGFVIYSSFISWQGCYKVNESQSISTKLKELNNGIADCVKTCTFFDFIGFSKDICYCFQNADLKSINRIDEVNCTLQMPYNIFFNSTGSKDNAIHVYRQFKNVSFDSDDCFGQCIIAKHISNTTVYETSSCYRKNDLVSGYICINASTGNLINIFNNSLESDNESLPLGSTSKERCWIGEFELCNTLSEKLLDEQKCSGIIGRMLSSKYKYTSRLYKSFKVVDKKTDTCLAVTKNADKLILDPDDCSVQKKHICNVYFKPIISTTNVAISTSLSANQNENTLHESIFYAVAISLAAITCLTCITVCIVRQLKRRKEQTHLQESLSVKNDETSTKAHKRAVDIDYIYSTVQSSTGTERASGKINEKYDILDYKYTPTNSDCAHRINECHVYDHTLTADNYDISRLTRPVNQIDSVTYSPVPRKNENTGDKDEYYSEIHCLSVKN